MTREDTDSMELDGETPLTPSERMQLRKMMRDDERASWAWKKFRVIVPAAVAVFVAFWQAGDWLAKHVKLTP